MTPGSEEVICCITWLGRRGKNTGYDVGMCELSQQYERWVLKVEKRIRFLFLSYL